MSLETITIIVLLTLLTIVVGADLFWLLVMVPALDSVSDGSLLNIIKPIQTYATQRMPIIFVLLLLNAIVLNVVPHTRTEIYLLRIGLIAFVIYTAVVLLGSNPVSTQLITGLTDNDLPAEIHSLQVTWTRLLWLRGVAALVTFWSFLHYAMNPRSQ
ncbi:MAG: hypothetical protein AAF708_03955 [Deinococcota bacterium]